MLSPYASKWATRSPVAKDAHFVGTSALDLDGTLPLNVHNAVLRCPASSTAALRNDGVEDVATLTLIDTIA
jgi:hypothetical protein